MASTTPQQTSRHWIGRRSTQPDTASSPQTSQTSSEAPLTSSDTQPRFLNNLQSAETTSSSSQAAIAIPTTTLQDPSSTKEPRLCWICQQEDTEDTPENNVWRTPCPCSLTAHDSCLLQWVANEEAPKPGQMAQKRKIRCPQCQAEITIQRPKDYLVSVVDSVVWIAKQMIIPASATATVGIAYSGCLVYGMNALNLVFGPEDTKAMLDAGFLSLSGSPTAASLLNGGMKAVRILLPFFPQAERTNATYITIPLIAPTLILFRTKFAEAYFPVFLIAYLIKNYKNSMSWPPSPGLAFVTIPYLRSFYNEIYRHTLYPYEKKWELAVQRKPREGETAEQIAAAARAEANEEDGHALFELEWVEEEIVVPGAEPEPEPAPEANVPLNEDGAEAQQPNPGPANENGAHNHNHNHNQNQNRDVVAQHDIDISIVASTILGTLFFPAISSLMGSLLKLTVPTSKGILKERWGRSIVGGCLFVVLKDAVVLYCKWKKARDFGKRKVLDFVGERGKA